MDKLFSMLLLGMLLFWQSNGFSCKSGGKAPPRDKMIVETQIKKTDARTTVEILFGTPIYWGEKGTYVERGTTPVELEKGTFEGVELTPFKAGETTKYKIEMSEDPDPEKTYRIRVTDKKGEEYQGEIRLGRRQDLMPVRESGK